MRRRRGGGGGGRRARRPASIPPQDARRTATLPDIEFLIPARRVGGAARKRVEMLRTHSMNAQLVRQSSVETAQCCAAACCGRVGLCFLLFIVGMVSLAFGAVRANEDGRGINLYLLVLATAPSIFILVYLSRTFGTSIDRCQVVLTFFTTTLWMVVLLSLESYLTFSGAFRVVYRLDHTCDICFAANECSDTCELGGHPLQNVSGLLNLGVNASEHQACDHSCGDIVPTALDATPAGPCACPWRTLVSAYITAGFAEETLKYVSVVTIHTKDWVADPQALVLYAATSGCAFALVENIMYVFQATTFGIFPERGVYTAVTRAFSAVPMHAGTACIIGAMLGRRRFVGRPDRDDLPEDQKRERLGYPRIIFLPILFHGTYDWVLMAAPFDGDINVALAAAILGLLWITARYQYVLVDSFPGVGRIPRVNVRELENKGVLPHATLSECLCHNVLCCQCGRCGDTRNRNMRLTTIQHASAANAGMGYSGLSNSNP